MPWCRSLHHCRAGFKQLVAMYRLAFADLRGIPHLPLREPQGGEHWGLVDMMTMVQQLGVFAAPSA